MPSAVIKSSDMGKEMETQAVFVAQRALEECTEEQEVARYVKQKFEKKYGHTWHCFAGRNFSSYVTHEKGNFIYFYIGHTGLLLFSTQ
jgi:dynein light chain LC8-type